MPPLKSDRCVICHNPFERKNKGFKRLAVVTVTSPCTFSKVFRTTSPTKHFVPGSYMCHNCHNNLKRRTKPKKKTNSVKRTWVERDSFCSPEKNLKEGPFHSTPRQPSKRPATFSTPNSTIGPISSPVFGQAGECSDSGYSQSLSLHDTQPGLVECSPQACEEKDLSYIEKAADYVLQYKYRQAFRTVVNNSQAAKDAILSVTSELIKQEVWN